mgnify:CR=1 FL=1
MNDAAPDYETLARAAGDAEAGAAAHRESMKAAEQFAPRACDRSYARLYRPTASVDALRDAFESLNRRGFDPFGPDDPARALLRPERLQRIADSVTIRQASACTAAGGPFRLDGVPLYPNGYIPDDEALVVHEDAVLPVVSPADPRPWLVRDNRGMATVVFTDG